MAALPAIRFRFTHVEACFVKLRLQLSTSALRNPICIRQHKIYQPALHRIRKPQRKASLHRAEKENLGLTQHNYFWPHSFYPAQHNRQFYQKLPGNFRPVHFVSPIEGVFIFTPAEKIKGKTRVKEPLVIGIQLNRLFQYSITSVIFPTNR